MIRKQRVRTEEELTISLFKLLKGSPQFKKPMLITCS